MPIIAFKDGNGRFGVFKFKCRIVKNSSGGSFEKYEYQEKSAVTFAVLCNGILAADGHSGNAGYT